MTDLKDNKIKDKVDRMRIVMDSFNMTEDVDFAKALTYSQGYISEILSRKKGVPKIMGQKIEDVFGIDRKWFESGDGEMFLRKEEKASHVEKYGDNGNYNKGNGKRNNVVNEPSAKYHVTEIIEPGIPMYAFPDNNIGKNMGNEIGHIGFLKIPGTSNNSFALPVHGESMHPTLINGNWGIVRPITDKHDIEWGHVYYVEYGDYKVWKRLLKVEEEPDSVMLWSDNQTETINDRPKYASKIIKAKRIKTICLLTDILQKPNY